MSTKTTIKRVALVAVAALGFGVFPAGVAQAAVSTYTSGSALSTTNMTVVSTTTGATMGGKFYLDVTGNGAAADDGSDNDYQGLFSSESITVTVTGSATGKTAADNSFADPTDVSIQAAIMATNTCSVGTETRGASAFTAVGTEGTGGSLQVPTSEQLELQTLMQAITVLQMHQEETIQMVVKTATGSASIQTAQKQLMAAHLQSAFV